jgi:hypothetical protein
MKQPINQSTSLDKCVAGVLLYQGITMTELRYDMVARHNKMWWSSSNPPALQHLGNVVSDFSLNILKQRRASYERRQHQFGCLRQTRTEVDVIHYGSTYYVCLDGTSCYCSRFS